MRAGHLKTWTKWLDKISPMSSTTSNYSSADRVAMAEALAIAAPEGPRGFRCIDECNCAQFAATWVSKR